jgi:type IV secretion system protein VirD4
VEQDGKRVLKLGLDLIVDPDGKGLQTHWQKTACSLLTGCIAHVLYRALKENHPATLPSVDQPLSDPNKKVVEVWTEMLANTYFHGDAHPLAASAARDQLNRPIEEAGSVLSTALSYLTLYRDPIVVKNVSRSDFRVRDPGCYVEHSGVSRRSVCESFSH